MQILILEKVEDQESSVFPSIILKANNISNNCCLVSSLAQILF